MVVSLCRCPCLRCLHRRTTAAFSPSCLVVYLFSRRKRREASNSSTKPRKSTTRRVVVERREKGLVCGTGSEFYERDGGTEIKKLVRIECRWHRKEKSSTTTASGVLFSSKTDQREKYCRRLYNSRLVQLLARLELCPPFGNVFLCFELGSEYYFDSPIVFHLVASI